MMSRSVCCIDMGCSENQLDGKVIRNRLAANEWEVVEQPENADLIVLNTCGFTREAERKAIAVYRDMLAIKRPDARVVFAGCLPAINRSAIDESGYGDVMITPRTTHRLDQLSCTPLTISAPSSRGCVPFASDRVHSPLRTHRVVKKFATALHALHVPLPRWYAQAMYLPDQEVEFVRISVGCMNHCTFCTIPRAKGRTSSVAPDTVVEQVESAVRRGKRQIALSCDELASYGQDLGTDIVDLLERIMRLPGSFELILRNVHPEWIIRYFARLKPLLRTGKICYMVIPVQSGSDRILGLMKRNHTAAEFTDLIRQIRTISPRTIVRTHVLVGFPGETDEDFKDTCDLIRNAPVDHFQVHAYSERAFTPSAGLPDKVPAEVARRRVRALCRLERRCFFRLFRWRDMRPSAPDATGASSGWRGRRARTQSFREAAMVHPVSSPRPALARAR